MRMWPAAAAAAALAALLTPAPGAAQTPQVRLAASTDCPRNINCIPGFKRVYGIDPTSVFTPRTVAVVFSSNPQLSRPDILTLRDDKGMISDDHIVPVNRRSLLRRYGRPLRRRLDTASRLLSTLELRGLNQQVIDGRIPEAVGGDFADANGLGGPSKRRKGPRIRIGFQAFDENQTLAYLFMDFAFTRPVRAIPYQGVPCTRATIRNGSYPATRPIGIVTVGRPKGALRRFLRWARTSRVARRVIATRYIPISRAR